MRAHYLQHVAFEGLGYIETWLKASGYEISRTPLYESSEFPNPDAIDFLIIMGGPMSVNEEEAYPWLTQEKAFIRDFIASGKPILGICLGAQLIANAAGARVYPNTAKEIGWFPIQGALSTDPSCFHFPPETDVFHWHGETFDLPAGATRLASSEGCQNQAFQIGTSIIGLQFHLETTQESMHEMVSHGRNELKPATYIQTETKILSTTPEHYERINDMMGHVLRFLTRHTS